MSDIAKKNLLSQLWDAFTDRVDELREDLKANHPYLSADQQAENLRTDIGTEVFAAGWIVSPGVIDALCKGGAALMTLDASTVTIDRVEPAGEAQDGEQETTAHEQEPSPPPAQPPLGEPSAPVGAPVADVSAQDYQRLVTHAAIRNRAGA